MVECNFERYVLRFFRNEDRLSLTLSGWDFMPIFSLVIGKESCCRVDDLSCVGSLIDTKD